MARDNESDHRGRVRLLLVDDDSPLQRSLSSRFFQRRLQVATASNKDEVFEQLDRHVFDVALVSAKLLDDSQSLLSMMHSIQPMLQILVLADGPPTCTNDNVLRHGAFDVIPPGQPDALAAKVFNANSVKRFQMGCLGPHG